MFLQHVDLNGVPPQGANDVNCESHFKLAFVPYALAFYSPFVSITFTGVDDYGAASSPITAYVFVKEINQPPIIWAPPMVVGGPVQTDPFIMDTDAASSTYNDPVTVNDVDSEGYQELLTTQVNPGYSGELLYASNVPCVAQAPTSVGASPTTWVCYNCWL